MNIKKDIEQICSEYVVDMCDIVKISKEDLDYMIKRNLAKELSEFIFNNIEILPINYTVKNDDKKAEYIYKVKMNVISDKELKRLRKIEHMYNDLWSFNTCVVCGDRIEQDKNVCENCKMEIYQ